MPQLRLGRTLHREGRYIRRQWVHSNTSAAGTLFKGILKVISYGEVVLIGKKQVVLAHKYVVKGENSIDVILSVFCVAKWRHRRHGAAQHHRHLDRQQQSGYLQPHPISRKRRPTLQENIPALLCDTPP